MTQGHKRATINAAGCGFDSDSRNGMFNIFIFLALVTTQNAALSSATQHAMPPEVGGKRETKVSYWDQSVLTLGFRFPAPTLLCAGYTMKAKKNNNWLNHFFSRVILRASIKISLNLLILLYIFNKINLSSCSRGTKCDWGNTRFTLPLLVSACPLCARYSVKLIFFYLFILHNYDD